MSWSLRIRNGDLATEGTSLGQVTGGAKLVQDLRCAILERRGTDDMHPAFGSLIDGGIDQYGNYVESLIGSRDWSLIAMRVESEIRRICSEQQSAQLVRSKQDRLTYGESTLDPSELLLEVTGVQMFQVQDTLIVRVTLTTGTGSTITVDSPVTSDPVITT